MGTKRRTVLLALAALLVVAVVAGLVVGRSLRGELGVSDPAVSSGEPVDFEMSVSPTCGGSENTGPGDGRAISSWFRQ